MGALSQRGGTWIGWSGKTSPNAEVHEVVPAGNVERVAISIPRDKLHGFYNQFANRTLWPALHYREDLIHTAPEDFDAYLWVNALFADAVAKHAKPGDQIWVHDYHLIPLGELLRERGLENRIGFFFHTPFPAPEFLTAVPYFDQLIDMLSAYDLVGFQTTVDVANCNRATAHFAAGKGKVRAGHFPIGVDAGNLRELAKRAVGTKAHRQFIASCGDTPFIIGVDRLDYSKGIENRFRAFDKFLTQAKEPRAAMLLQVSPPSRGDIAEYKALRRDIEFLVGDINGRHNEPDWVAIRHLHKSLGRRTLAGFYRAARAALVTPLRDGMNLVAKEYVACQDPEDPGVLILSRFAGAAEQLDAALIVNPHDECEMANAIAQALAMPLAERKRRYERLAHSVFTDTADAWARKFLDALDGGKGASAKSEIRLRPANWVNPGSPLA